MLNKAVINLSTLIENVKAVKSIIPPSTKFCAVVKADAYGHGAVKIASALYPFVDFYAVALLEEGVELRLGGIDKNVLVMTPVYPVDAEKLVRFSLTATVSDFYHLSCIRVEAERQKKRATVHVKFNTGMNRQGVDNLEELESLLRAFHNDKWINIGGIYSHFARPENKKQRTVAENKFLLANNLIKRYNNKAISHISASGGVLEGVFYDMVRVGVMLYGYKPFKSDKVSLKPVMKVYSPVLASRWIDRGENLLYGKYRLKKKRKISLVRFGYADGLPRKAVLGQRNNRCMDITATDKVCENKYFLVMDDAELIAKKYKTISYEILTCVSKRAEKIYVQTEDE